MPTKCTDPNVEDARIEGFHGPDTQEATSLPNVILAVCSVLYQGQRPGVTSPTFGYIKMAFCRIILMLSMAFSEYSTYGALGQHPLPHSRQQL